MKTSGLFSLNLNDFAKGGIMAVGGAVLAVVESSFEAGKFNLDFTNIWHVAAAAVVVYLTKNFFTPAVTPPVS